MKSAKDFFIKQLICFSFVRIFNLFSSPRMLLIPNKRDFLITFRVKGFFCKNKVNTRLIRELVRSPLFRNFICIAKRLNSWYACYQLDKLWNTREARRIFLRFRLLRYLRQVRSPHAHPEMTKLHAPHTFFPYNEILSKVFFSKKDQTLIGVGTPNSEKNPEELFTNDERTTIQRRRIKS